MLQNLLTGSEGLGRREDALGMPQRTRLGETKPLHRAPSGSNQNVLWCAVSDNSCCPVVWKVSFDIHLCLKKPQPKQPTWLCSDGWSSGDWVAAAFVSSQVMDAGCHSAKRWMSSPLHLGWTGGQWCVCVYVSACQGCMWIKNNRSL